MTWSNIYTVKGFFKPGKVIFGKKNGKRKRETEKFSEYHLKNEKKQLKLQIN